METISKDLFYELLNHLNIKALLELCITNKQFNKLCNNETLWRMRLKRDYPNIKINNNYKQGYLDLYNKDTRSIPIYYNDTYIIDLWVNKYDNFETIIEKLKNIEIINGLLKKDISVIFKHYETILIIGKPNGVKKSYHRPDEKITSIYIYDSNNIPQIYQDVMKADILNRPVSSLDLFNFHSGVTYRKR